MRMLKHFLVACVLTGAMIGTVALVPVQADAGSGDDCFHLCIGTSDWELCIILCT